MVSELLNVPSVTVYFSSTIINSCISSFLNVISLTYRFGIYFLIVSFKLFLISSCVILSFGSKIYFLKSLPKSGRYNLSPLFVNNRCNKSDLIASLSVLFNLK